MRVYKRINDVYEVELPDCKKYFQFLQSDSALSGGEVIAIFNEKYGNTPANIELSNIYFRNIDSYESIID